MLQNLNLINYFDVSRDVLMSCNVLLEFTYCYATNETNCSFNYNKSMYYFVNVFLVIQASASRLNSLIIPDSYVNNW